MEDRPQQKYMHVARWELMAYDMLMILVSVFLLQGIYARNLWTDIPGMIQHMLLAIVIVLPVRYFFQIYRQIWRYGGIQCYMRLIFADMVALVIYLILERVLPLHHIRFVQSMAFLWLDLLGALSLRMMYRYCYKCGNPYTKWGRFLNHLIRIFAGSRVQNDLDREADERRIRIAIVGAGRIGTSLCEELMTNTASVYAPRCFIDVSEEKVGRQIYGIPVYREEKATLEILKAEGVQEIVFAMSHADGEKTQRLYQYYQQTGCNIKVYDYPTMQTAGKRHVREFDAEELLFRKPVLVVDEKTHAYFRDKVVMVTGGGGSIGSELLRQIARMEPKALICVDICENGAYDVQQEIAITSQGKLKLQVEILSIVDRQALFSVMERYHPQIVLHAAAHKHVPLMEHNCKEAVNNNVFGTLNVVEACEKYHVERMIMISTDKAVNPTNVMGATKRICEMIVLSHAANSQTVFSCTRFGNVLGSAGSVIPLFRRQISYGGPVTITDKRIIRYFMTIPEASQLVLQSSAMAKSGELFVLDMGKPVKILELAESMIRMSGYTPYQDIDIVETGLRPGEKLYEELLVKTEELDRTDNQLIFIERDRPLSLQEVDKRLEMLRRVARDGDDAAIREVLRKVVPTFRRPEEVNAGASLTQ